MEDGVERFFDEKVGLPDDEERGRVKPKAELAVFAPTQRRQELPSSLSREVMDLRLEAGWSGEDANRDDE